STGNVYVTGTSDSLDFPTMVPFQANLNGATLTDVVVTKLDPLTNSLLFSTYLGGTADDAGISMALDTARNVYVTGFTKSTDFPLGGPTIQAANHGAGAAFVTCLAASGSSLVYSTYL